MATTSRKANKQVKDTELVWPEKTINLIFYIITFTFVKYLHFTNTRGTFHEGKYLSGVKCKKAIKKDDRKGCIWHLGYNFGIIT